MTNVNITAWSLCDVRRQMDHLEPFEKMHCFRGDGKKLISDIYRDIERFYLEYRLMSEGY